VSSGTMSSGTVTVGRPWWVTLLLRGPADQGSVLAKAALTLLIAAAAGLAVYSGYIHLYLWGWAPFPYKSIPTIGPLFLLQGIGAILIGLLVVITRRFYAVLLGLGLMVLSIAAIVFDVEVGMFGFKDSWQVPYAKSTLYEEIFGAVMFLIATVVLAWPSIRAMWAGDC
jgi:hypothetical protein